jgi:hypothetical protein
VNDANAFGASSRFFVNLCVSRENQGKNSRFKPEDLEPFESAPFSRPLLLVKERSPPGGGLPGFEFDFWFG